MRFQVPQFIDTETKLIGPFTLMQFLFVAGGVSMLAVVWILLNGLVFAIVALLIAAFFGALAFLRIDGQPFLNYLAYMLSYALGSKRAVYQIKQESNQFTPPTNGN
ncbi:MAG: PrgI family protein [Candidatus Pacebacteria bacterium]|nr:PrgI family protein [Candidatus Paceibacterota bacterium]